MNKPKNQFPLKIILSYLVIGTLAVVVSYFLYTEYKTYMDSNVGPETEKIIETGTLINEVYETDSFSRRALLTKTQVDFDDYLKKTDSLYKKIDELKALIPNDLQKQQLDSVKLLLKEKTNNIEQLRLLKLTSERDTSLDDILREFKKFDRTIGRVNVEDLVKSSYRKNMSSKERRIYQSYADYINETSGFGSNNVKSMTIDSLLAISRYIVLEAKKENSITRKALREKENELLQNELNISFRLRKIITNFDAEINSNNFLEAQKRRMSEARTKKILKIAGIVGLAVVLIFSYIITTDFFKTEKFKRRLQEEKQYSEDLLKDRKSVV